MKLVYLKKNLNNSYNSTNYFTIEQSHPSYTCEVGSTNKRGQTLLYVIYITRGKMYILNSWADYYKVNDKLRKKHLFGHITQFNKELRNKFAYKLIQLAYKIKK